MKYPGRAIVRGGCSVLFLCMTIAVPALYCVRRYNPKYHEGSLARQITAYGESTICGHHRLRRLFDATVVVFVVRSLTTMAFIRWANGKGYKAT
ncbi:hypothetical protein B0J13DRAFT_260829 [Dactylonectria estremocensis]|uniref:Uncharacterized protein n=1 Tax=Dactylonectria estremocensis TaxID=1079267 RepID=A0A9P9JCR3_9HYPO|nr:hypothetical protein B0J13DRAFT_260829 [Dactylonectria estremocensis]